MFYQIPPGHKCFVIDDECFTILCQTNSVSVANAICKGILNTTTMVVPLEEELNEELNYKLLQQGGIVSQMGNPKIGVSNSAWPGKLSNKRLRYGVEEVPGSQRYLERKNLAKKRQYGLEHLESGLHRYIARLTNFCLDEGFYHFAARELDLSDPDNNKFSDAIVEWSNIYKCQPREAYWEIKTLYDSTSINIIKMHAVWNKYVDRVNKLTDIKDIHVCSVSEFEAEMFFGGQPE